MLKTMDTSANYDSHSGRLCSDAGIFLQRERRKKGCSFQSVVIM